MDFSKELIFGVKSELYLPRGLDGDRGMIGCARASAGDRMGHRGLMVYWREETLAVGRTKSRGG